MLTTNLLLDFMKRAPGKEKSIKRHHAYMLQIHFLMLKLMNILDAEIPMAFWLIKTYNAYLTFASSEVQGFHNRCDEQGAPI